MLHVAIARQDAVPGAANDAVPAWFGASERQRWQALSPAARRAFVDSRSLLRQLLQRATGVEASCWAVSAEAGRAPVASAPQVDAVPAVSLSHRLTWVAAAVAAPALGPIGVDIECERPPRSDPHERAALMLADDERADWLLLPEARRELGLLMRWTAKEAWYKSTPPDDAAWDFRGVAALACEPGRANVRVWHASPVVLALCCDDPAALAAAPCTGWAEGQPPSAWSWRVARCG